MSAQQRPSGVCRALIRGARVCVSVCECVRGVIIQTLASGNQNETRKEKEGLKSDKITVGTVDVNLWREQL